jgi:bla regulator protein blaR1
MKRTVSTLLATFVSLFWWTDIWADRSSSDGWVILNGASNTMSGNMADIDDAKALQRGGEPLVYVRRGDKAWVIRDPAQVARARGFFAPVEEVSKKMEPLGKRMEAIGARQQKVGMRMEPLGLRMGELGLELASLDPDDDKRDEIQDEMERLQAKMQVLQRKMEALSTEMQPMSQEMEKLGKVIERASKKAEVEIGEFLDAAIAGGVAQPVR